MGQDCQDLSLTTRKHNPKPESHAEAYPGVGWVEGVAPLPLPLPL